MSFVFGPVFTLLFNQRNAGFIFLEKLPFTVEKPEELSTVIGSLNRIQVAQNSVEGVSIVDDFYDL